jgi:hypothetical protein
MDRDERARVRAMVRAARVRVMKTIPRDHSLRPGLLKKTVLLNQHVGSLHYANGIVAAAAVEQMMVRKAEFQEAQGVTVEHVRNGKPLTAHGAKLLGVKWEPEGL